MKIEIKQDPDHTNDSVILLDGQNISNAVHHVKFEHGAGELPVVTLKLYGELHLETESKVVFEYPHKTSLKFKGRRYGDGEED